MRKADEFDELADEIVFTDPDFGNALEESDDTRMSRRLAAILRERFGKADQPATTETGPIERAFAADPTVLDADSYAQLVDMLNQAPRVIPELFALLRKRVAETPPQGAPRCPKCGSINPALCERMQCLPDPKFNRTDER